jgi:hypothetical protein
MRERWGDRVPWWLEFTMLRITDASEASYVCQLEHKGYVRYMVTRGNKLGI